MFAVWCRWYLLIKRCAWLASTLVVSIQRLLLEMATRRTSIETDQVTSQVHPKASMKSNLPDPVPQSHLRFSEAFACALASASLLPSIYSLWSLISCLGISIGDLSHGSRSLKGRMWGSQKSDQYRFTADTATSKHLGRQAARKKSVLHQASEMSHFLPRARCFFSQSYRVYKPHFGGTDPALTGIDAVGWQTFGFSLSALKSWEKSNKLSGNDWWGGCPLSTCLLLDYIDYMLAFDKS